MLKKDLKIKFSKIGKFLKRIPYILGKKAFFTFLILLFLGIVFGAILLYQSTISAKKFQPEISGKLLQFDEKLLGKILEKQEERQEIFETATGKQYTDIFWRVIPPEETLE